MNFVMPIKDDVMLEDICDYLKAKNPPHYVWFSVGIYTGLRISDILALKVIDVKDRSFIISREIKTGKARRTALNVKKLIPILKAYCSGRRPHEYLFLSNRGSNKAISRFTAYKVIKEIGKIFKLDNIGTHTMRKTFGFHHYQQYHDVAKLMKIFNHDDQSTTMRYIGLEQDDMDETLKNFDYKRR